MTMDSSSSGSDMPPIGYVQEFLGEDHARLDDLLQRSVGADGLVDRDAYEEFRRGLLQHIAMEEKVLIPSLRQLDSDVEHTGALVRLRRDHGLIAHMLAVAPQPFLLKELRDVLVPHNAIEEGENGLYSRADALGESEAQRLVAEMKAVPPVKVTPFRRR